jgi:hypothetical protein
MRGLKGRVEAMEQQLMPPSAERWVRVLQDSDQTEEQAISAYEAEHGPIGDANVFIVRFV